MVENFIFMIIVIDFYIFIVDIFFVIFEDILKSIVNDFMYKLFGESEVILLCCVVLCLLGVY